MTEHRQCPECGSRIVLSERLAERDNGMDVGCANTAEHDDAETLVMWSED